MSIKILHIVRHGKALRDYRAICDCDRPLVEKGIVTSIAIAERLYERYAAPSLIVSSHAARTLHTAHIFAGVMKYPHEKVRVDEKLYLDGKKEIYSILKGLPDELDSVMIVGHNPDITLVAGACFGCAVESIPASGAISIRFEADRWSDANHVKEKADCAFFFPNT
jgi:phosphohistidine phosphatase